MVVVLWHDVGRLCRFLLGRCYRELCSSLLVVSVFCVSFIYHLFVAGLVVVAQSDV